jgi:hypothetical protein
MHSRARTGPSGSQLSNTMVDAALWPLRPLGQVGLARVVRAAKGRLGGQGQLAAAIDVPRANGSPFSPDHPRLVCCNDFKGGSKARCSSSTTRIALRSGGLGRG